MRIRSLVCAALLGTVAIAGTAGAQPKPQAQQTHAKVPQLTPAQKAALQKQNAVLEKYALQVATMIDQGKAAEVWQGASEVAKKAVTQAAFVKSASDEHSQLGTATSRRLEMITRAFSKGGKLPAGLYVNVNFATKFSKYAKPVRELVSFHLDSDKVWRLSGYTVH